MGRGVLCVYTVILVPEEKLLTAGLAILHQNSFHRRQNEGLKKTDKDSTTL
jgi:hypothetical protein